MFSGLKPYLSGFSVEKCVVAATLVISLTIIISGLVGFFRLDMPLILLTATILSLWLAKGYKSEAVDGKIFLLALFLFTLLIYPIIAITPIFPASNDAASTTTMRVLSEKIELDYAQYGKLNMPYPIGLPVMAKALHSIIPVIPDYLSPYLIGLIAGVLQIFFVYLIASTLFKDKKAGIISAALLFASKYIFENIYVGELAWYLGSALMLGFIYLFLKKNRLQYVVFPAIFLAHPVAGVNTLLFLAAYYSIERANFLKELSKLFSTLIIIIPGIIITYLPIAINILQAGFAKSESLGAIKMLSMLPIWVGTGLTVITLASIGYLILSRKKIAIEKGHKIIIALFAISLIALVVFELMHFMLSHKVIEMIILSLIFIGGAIISRKELNLLDGKKEVAVLLGVLLIGMVFFATSTTLGHYRSGSKISSDAREFSVAFYNFDKEQKKVLFLTKWGGKIAEYSNKIPFDITVAHSIISFDFMYYHNDAFYEMRKNEQTWKEIFLDKKTELIADLNIDYIVVNQEEWNIDLNYPIVFEYNDFMVYQKKVWFHEKLHGCFRRLL